MLTSLVQLYLTKPDYDEAISDRTINIERMLWEDRDRPDSEEIYRKTYQSNSGALYFAQCENPNETWLPLLEKAYAKAHGDYAAIEGGFTGEGIEDLTGGVTTGLYTTDILDKVGSYRRLLGFSYLLDRPLMNITGVLLEGGAHESQ